MPLLVSQIGNRVDRETGFDLLSHKLLGLWIIYPSRVDKPVDAPEAFNDRPKGPIHELRIGHIHLESKRGNAFRVRGATGRTVPIERDH